MNCSRCGSKIEKDWGFCPRCGSRTSGDFFEGIFSRMRKEIAEMNRLFEKDIEAFDLSPWFRDMQKSRIFFHPKSSGFSIKIVQSGGKKPEISVRTFGDMDREKVKREIEGMGELRREPVPVGIKPERQEARRPLREPTSTEEPKTSIKRSLSGVTVEMELPGVKSEEDIEICELENSLEVKAFAGGKAYFKIITKPPKFRLAKKSFQKGTLRMEFC